MAQVTLTLTESCPSQQHHKIELTGDRTGTVRVHNNEIFSLALSNDELLDFMLMYLRIYTVGRTNAQVRTALQAGLVITI